MKYESFESMEELIKQAQEEDPFLEDDDDFEDEDEIGLVDPELKKRRKFDHKSYGERRFRGSIYVDVFVQETDDKEYDRERAVELLRRVADFLSSTNEFSDAEDDLNCDLGNAYTGGAGEKQGLTFDKDF